MGQKKTNCNPLSRLPSAKIIRQRLSEIKREEAGLKILLTTIEQVEASQARQGGGQVVATRPPNNST